MLKNAVVKRSGKATYFLGSDRKLRAENARWTYNSHLGEHFEVLPLGHGGSSLKVRGFGLAEAGNGVQLD